MAGLRPNAVDYQGWNEAEAEVNSAIEWLTTTPLSVTYGNTLLSGNPKENIGQRFKVAIECVVCWMRDEFTIEQIMVAKATSAFITEPKKSEAALQELKIIAYRASLDETPYASRARESLTQLMGALKMNLPH